MTTTWIDAGIPLLINRADTEQPLIMYEYIDQLLPQLEKTITGNSSNRAKKIARNLREYLLKG